LGLAQLAKFSGVVLFPLFGLVVILYAFSKPRPDTLEETQKSSWRRALVFSFILKFIGSIAVCFAVIWSLYAINTWNMPASVVQEIARAQFPSDRLVGRLAESTVIGMSNIPLMKPLAQYFLGVFMVFARVSGGNTYFFFDTVSNQATPLYFPAIFLMKETLPFLAILAFGLAYGLWRIVKVARADREEGKKWSGVLAHSFHAHVAQYTMLGFIVLYGYLRVTGNLNIGVRHLFPLLPFFYLLGTKAVFDYWKRHRGNHSTWTILRGFVFIFTVWIILIPVFAYPSYLSYFNSATGGHLEGYKYVTDSNYDWGQDAKRLKNWVDEYNLCVNSNIEQTADCQALTSGKPFPSENAIQKIRVDYFGGSSPEYYLGAAYTSWHSNLPPEPGWYAVSAGFYQESIYKKDQPANNINYSWLPKSSWIGRAGDSIFIFYVDKLPGM